MCLPQTRNDRRQRAEAWVLLVRRVCPRRAIPIEGRFFRAGERVETLWPAEDYPEAPLVVEYAGNEPGGRGHNRARAVHVLWRYDGRAWIELARVASHGREWMTDFVPLIQRELAAPAPEYVAEMAFHASSRVLEFLDKELDKLGDECRGPVMGRLFDGFVSRLVAA